jgi:uncharacterized membrane protein SirB2
MLLELSDYQYSNQTDESIEHYQRVFHVLMFVVLYFILYNYTQSSKPRLIGFCLAMVLLITSWLITTQETNKRKLWY